MSNEKNSFQKLISTSGSSVNLVNLILIATIGWNARDVASETLSKIENTAIAIQELTKDFKSLKTAVDSNTEMRNDYYELKAKVEAEREDSKRFKEAVRECLKNRRRKCDL